MHRPPTHYDILEVSAEATPDEIRDAYRALRLTDQPNKNPGDPGADDAMADIDAAYEVLSDPARRREYDLSLQELRGEEGGTPAPEPAHKHKAPPAPRDDEALQRAVNREFLTRVTHIAIGVAVAAAFIFYCLYDCMHDADCHMTGHFRRNFLFW